MQEEDKEEKKEGEEKKGSVQCLVVCHTRELAYQIKREYDRFAKHFGWVKLAVVYGGNDIKKDHEAMAEKPHIVIGTPGRVLALINEKDESKKLILTGVKQFVLDECDKCLEKPDMRKDV